ncbi:MAG: hypothetical protein C0401_09920 [Anaerolinea sp.]|nr:hypothetical protein [Anaerolinea sp.]
MTELKNKIYKITLEPTNGTFDILTHDPQLPDLLKVRLKMVYRWRGRQFVSLQDEWEVCDQNREIVNSPEHGMIELITLAMPADIRGIAYRLQFGVMQEYPLAIWKVEMINQGEDPVVVESMELLGLDANRSGSVKWANAKTQKELGFFSNGWQSWSPAQWYSGDSRMNISRLGGLQNPMIYNHGTPLPKETGQFSSDFFAVVGDRVERTGFVIGFLSQKNHFGSISADFNRQLKLKLWANGDDTLLDPEKSMTTDWAVFNPVLLDHREPLNKYLEAVARENHIRVPEDSPVGWCSWYHFYTHISEKIVQDNLAAILYQQETLPIQLVQIDDGFERQVGDWFSFKSEFPNGVAPLAKEINNEGLLPGLWLAPFIVHPKAEIVKNHPDWLLRKINGKPVNAGFVWGTLTTALDLTVPEALDYACSVVKTASADWGFPYLKLDFLYAAALPGRYKDPTLTRAQVLRKGMETIREAVGSEVTLLGCGAPFGPMLGLVDVMRIGADVSGHWCPKFNGFGLFIKNEPAFPCARNSIRNILTRANLHKYWWINDPDCLLIRPETNLSLAEVQSLASAIALTGGSLLLSDDLTKLSKERLRIAECLLPVIGERARIIDWFATEMPSKLRLDQVNETGEWHILTKFNWSPQRADLVINSEEFQLVEEFYWVREFWNGKSRLLKIGESIIFENVPANGCVVAAFRRFSKGQPCYLGSDLHISQGLEVAKWSTNATEVNLTLRLPRKATGKIIMFVPGGVQSVMVNDKEVAASSLELDLFSISIEMEGFAHIVMPRKH